MNLFGGKLVVLMEGEQPTVQAIVREVKDEGKTYRVEWLDDDDKPSGQISEEVAYDFRDVT